MSASLEAQLPLCTLVAETSLGSDHTPLILDTGEGTPIRSNRFFFETGWFEMPEFHQVMLQSWERLTQCVRGRDIIDWCNFMSGGD